MEFRMSQGYQHLTVARDKSICTVRFGHRENRNALSADVIEELASLAMSIRKDSEIAVVILAGSDSFFSAGADIKDKRLFQPDTSISARRDLALGGEMARAWETLPQITIAAVEGYALGGALSLALACDFRVAALGCFFSVPELSRGVSYGMNSIPRLVATIGATRAKRMVILEERVSAEEAFSWGMVDRIVPDGRALQDAFVMAEEIARKPRLPTEINKRAINALSSVFSEIGSHADMDQIALCAAALRS
jgi:enoyl-CoA hydratase